MGEGAPALKFDKVKRSRHAEGRARDDVMRDVSPAEVSAALASPECYLLPPHYQDDGRVRYAIAFPGRDTAYTVVVSCAASGTSNIARVVTLFPDRRLR